MIPILYEDRDLTVCVKPAGVVSEGEGLPAMLETQLKGKFFCVHRLDRETAGVMVLARNEKTAAALSRAFSAHETRKIYLALAEGQTESENGEMRDLLYHDRQRNKTYVVDRQRAGVHEAALRWEMIRTGYRENAEEKSVPVTLYRVALETGRTHQIRVQFASRGMPLVGDRKYGSHIRAKDLMLFAAELSFTHPATGKSMRFTARPDWPEAVGDGEINVKEGTECSGLTKTF